MHKKIRLIHKNSRFKYLKYSNLSRLSGFILENNYIKKVSGKPDTFFNSLIKVNTNAVLLLSYKSKNRTAFLANLLQKVCLTAGIQTNIPSRQT